MKSIKTFNFILFYSVIRDFNNRNFVKYYNSKIMYLMHN